MRKSLLIFLIFLFGAFAVSGQTTAKLSARPAEPVFEREKFDPAKDSAADLKAAVTRAAAENKRIILDIGGEWCVWCRHMDKFFHDNTALTKLRDDNYVWVKVNMSEENENKTFLSAYPEIVGYPHLYVLDKTGKLLQSQSTDVLESKKTYDLIKFTDFLNKWAPEKKKETK